VLVELYAESKFPNKAVLPVISFVIKHLVRPKDTSTFILSLDQIKTITVEEPSTVIGRTIFDLLLTELWSINSFDSLHTFFSDVQLFLDSPEKEDPPDTHKNNKKRFINPTSILGCFIRRACLEFVRLQFNEANLLWRAFVQFREPTLSLWKGRKLGAGPMTFDVNLKGLALDDLIVRKVYGGMGEIKDCESVAGTTHDPLLTSVQTPCQRTTWKGCLSFRSRLCRVCYFFAPSA
jgi:anaphase-promoting complex subunit 5